MLLNLLINAWLFIHLWFLLMVSVTALLVEKAEKKPFFCSVFIDHCRHSLNSFLQSINEEITLGKAMIRLLNLYITDRPIATHLD